MPYVDLSTLHNPSVGGIAPATWGIQIDGNFEHLIARPSCRVRNTGVQAVGTSLDSVISFGAERWDTASMHDNAINNGRVTFPIEGRYLVGGHAAFQGNAGGDMRALHIRKNGSIFVGSHQSPNTGGHEHQLSVISLIRANVGDYCELVVWQNSGVTLNIQNINEHSAEFWAILVSL